MKTKKSQILIGAGALVAAISFYGGLASVDVQAKMGPGAGGNPSQGQGQAMQVQSENGRGPQGIKGNNEQGNQNGPDRGPRGGMMLGRSEQAVAACNGKVEQDACSFTPTMPDGTVGQNVITGTCANMPRRDKNEQGEQVVGAATEVTQLICMPGNRYGNFREEGRVQRAKAFKAQQISKIENRVEKIIAFLKSQNVDTSIIESNYATFKSKADIMQQKTAAYAALETDTTSTEEQLSASLNEVRLAGKDMMDYFRTTLRPSLQSAIESLTN